MINCENLLEKTKKYYTAWWNCEVLDKVPFMVTAPQENQECKLCWKSGT